jgi:nicotinate-nucleotide adenylyltransferase
MSMRIAMFGGSFDPPHLGHLIFAEHACDALALDRVLFVPAAHSPFKSSTQPDNLEHRLAMVRFALAGNDRFSLDLTEIERGGTSYTVDTVQTLHALYPDAILHVLMGQDAFEEFEQWKNPETIVACATLGVGRRPGFPRIERKHLFADHAVFFDSPLIDVSSSAIRRLVSQRQSVRYLVPDAVLQYIEQHGIYQNATGAT